MKEWGDESLERGLVAMEIQDVLISTGKQEALVASQRKQHAVR